MGKGCYKVSNIIEVTAIGRRGPKGDKGDQGVSIKGDKGDKGEPGIADDNSIASVLEDPNSETSIILFNTIADTVDGPLSMVQAARFLTGRLEKPGAVDLSKVTTDLPTITNGSSATVNGRVENANSDNLTKLGRVGAWVSGATDVDGDFTGREFFLDTDTFEFSWKARGTNSARFTILVDGLPTALTPITPPGTTNAGATYYLKAVFGSAKRRKITVLATRISAWGAFRFGATADVQASPRKPAVTAVGASFDAGFTSGDNTSALEGIGVNLARLLDVDIIIAGREGTGFLNAGATYTYSDPARIARGTEKTPELVIFTGSGNDLTEGTAAQLKTAALTCLNAWAAATPASCPFVLIGVPPRNATDTIAATTAAHNNALREVAAEHPRVIAFLDMLAIPTDAPPAAHSSGVSTYVAGDLVSHNGSVWQLAPHIVGATPAGTVPGSSERWLLKTAVYSGTGKVGSTTGNGTRDVLLSADGTHPTPSGMRAFARWEDSALRAVLATV